MNVDELIKKLSKIQNKNKPINILLHNRSENRLYLSLNDLIEDEDKVLIGNDLPVDGINNHITTR
jgi:hypothetical protein